MLIYFLINLVFN